MAAATTMAVASVYIVQYERVIQMQCYRPVSITMDWEAPVAEDYSIVGGLAGNPFNAFLLPGWIAIIMIFTAALFYNVYRVWAQVNIMHLQNEDREVKEYMRTTLRQIDDSEAFKDGSPDSTSMRQAREAVLSRDRKESKSGLASPFFLQVLAKSLCFDVVVELFFF